MKLATSLLALTAAIAVAGAVPAFAQTADQPPPPPAAEAPAVSPESLAALQRMGAFLATLQSFEITSESSLDLVTAGDQTIDLDGVTTYQVRRPDAFVIENRTDRKWRRYIYDGSKFTVHAPERKVFATVAAPPTIREVLDQAATQYGVELPLEDLFHWGDPDALPQNLTSGELIGITTIGGVETEHYAFRGPEADWQIWIQRGDQPVPRKIVIVDRSDPARPEYTARLTWNLSPTFDARTFAFTPAADDMAITFADR